MADNHELPGDPTNFPIPSLPGVPEGVEPLTAEERAKLKLEWATKLEINVPSEVQKAFLEWLGTSSWARVATPESAEAQKVFLEWQTSADSNKDKTELKQTVAELKQIATQQLTAVGVADEKVKELNLQVEKLVQAVSDGWGKVLKIEELVNK